ncbi:MAG: AI-2E family transporter [Clostridia bacterium]|nr:AI-2E family transporter [Clostridia bacterium]
MEPNYAKRIYGLALILVGVWILLESEAVFSVLGAWTELLRPILLGVLFAFLLNLPLRLLEEIWGALPLRNRRRARRAVCLCMAVLLSVGSVLLLLGLLLPRLSEAVSELMGQLPDGLARLWEIAEGWGIPLPELPDAERWGEIWNRFLTQYGERLARTAILTLLGAFGGVLDTAIAFVLALYILGQKEKLRGQLARGLRAIFPNRWKSLLDTGDLICGTFSRFFARQTAEGAILGGLCFLGMTALRLPFALLASVIVGITALIPIFGAWLGIGLGGILVASVNPTSALWFLIFMVVLQQLEDHLIYPRMMGRSLGLPGIWVLCAVTVGGALGVGWLLVSVPAASVAYTLFGRFVRRREG